MNTSLGYHGDSQAFKDLDKLISSSNAFGEGFLSDIRTIMFRTFFVDKEGVKENVEENIHTFVLTYTKRILIFELNFIKEIEYLLRLGLEESCKIFPIKTE